jgi:DNA end-binding protein Ku
MPHLPAPAPSRASGKFSISFGLLNIGVDIFTGTEEVRVKRSEYTSAGRKVGNQKRIKNEDGTYGEPVDKGDVVKKYESDNGLIEITDDEIDALSTVVPGVADILGVLRFDFLANGSYVPNGMVWQVRASKLGSGRAAKDNPGGEKAFALLLTALKAESSFALLRFAKGGAVYHAALLPTGRLVGLHTDEEVRQERPLPLPELPKAEVDFARDLLRYGAKTERVSLTNDLAAKVAEYAAEKAAGTATPVEIKTQSGEQVVDLMAQLRASVEAAKAAKVSA